MSETETEAVETEENEDSKGVPGQIQYPDPTVDAERAAGFAAGNYDSLEPSEDEGGAEGDEEDA